MKKRRIACLTYHKYPGADWPSDEFIATEVRMASGQQITIRLAERGTKLSNGLWVREFRKLCESAHPVHPGPAAVLAPAMFGRWSQENFFRYMRHSFNLDGLLSCSENVPETIIVVSPAHRVLDGEVRKKVGLLNRRIAELGAINLDGEIEPATVEAYAQKKSDLREVITRLKKEVDELKAQRKATQRLAYRDLPADTRFDRLSTQSKHLVERLMSGIVEADRRCGSGCGGPAVPDLCSIPPCSGQPVKAEP